MHGIIRYVLEMRDNGLKIHPNRSSWSIQAFSDSDFPGDRETSIYEYFLYYCGIKIAWKSEGMRSVVLSTTEAEYIALSVVGKRLNSSFNC